MSVPGWSWDAKHVLVAGGCGLIGSYLVPLLVSHGATVTVVDNADRGCQENLERLKDEVNIIHGDLRDSALCERVIRGQDVVMNLAARAYGMGYSRTHHGEMLIYNLLATFPILDAARRQGVERFLVVSSSCVYADDAPIPTPELPAFLGTPEGVNEGYGWAKRVQELAATYYAREYGMNINIVRPFNVYGANYIWQSPEKAHVIPALVKKVMDGEDPLIVWGSGKQRRDFVHGYDAAQLIVRIMEKNPVAIPINVGYNDDVALTDLVDLICDVTGLQPQVVFDTTKPEGHFRKSSDPTLLDNVTGGYKPQVSLRQGIGEMVDWYKRSFQSA